MKLSKFKSNKEANKYLKANGKYNSKNELVLKEGIKTLQYPDTTEEGISLKLELNVQ